MTSSGIINNTLFYQERLKFNSALDGGKDVGYLEFYIHQGFLSSDHL